MRRAGLFEGQWIHLLGLGALLVGFERLSRLEGFDSGVAWGLDASGWAVTAVGVAVVHQIYVWLCWRLELGSSLLSRTLGGGAFEVYAVGFSILGIARVVSVCVLAVANRGTLDLAVWLRRPLALLLLLPVLWTFDSIRRHFTFRRAFGADHFDPAYRELGLVDEGIFGYTDNAMYTCGLLVLWVPGVWFGSMTALWVALFNHLYIWVHFLATERPDMRHIYGPER